MGSFLSRFANSLVLVLLLLVQTIGLAVQVRRSAEPGAAADSPRVVLARSLFVAAVSPVERVVHTASSAVRSAWGNYLDLRNTRRQNLALQHELDSMRLQQAAIAEDAVQGHRLQALLAFQQHYVSGTIAAQVIGTSGTELSRVLYIDKGAADGLKPDMAVITPDGIVGKIREVYPAKAPHVAQVLLVSDQTAGAGIILAKTRVLSVLHGTTAGFLQITNLTQDDRIQPGEQVLTSGGDGIFPRGLPVGRIESIAPDPEHQPYTAIRVRPAANLTRLEEVLIITGTQSSLPLSTLASLAHGAAATAAARTAAQKAAADKAAADEAARQQAARSAAEVVAGRLPSLYDPNDPNAPTPDAQKDPATAANPRTAGGVVPHPLPTLHTDRYSPGTAPPAAALTPGARHDPANAPAEQTAPPPNRRNAQPDSNASPPQP